MSKAVRIGFIGAGDMAVTHAVEMGGLPGEFEIMAAADVSEERLSAFRGRFGDGIAACADYRKLLERDDLDAVIIASPNHLHLEHACAAFDAGLHVLLQKPMALNLGDCDTITAAGKAAGKTLQVGLVYRYSALFRMMAGIIQEGRIGEPAMAWCHEFRVPFPIGRGREWRYRQAESGGSLVEKDCHHFDLFNWMLGALPVRAHAIGGNFAVRENGAIEPGVPGEPYRFPAGEVNDIIDHAWVNIEFEAGRSANLGLALFSGNRDLPVGVLGTHGWIEANVQQKKLFLHTGRPGHVEVIEPEKAAHELADKGHSGGARELLEFARCVRTGEAPFCDGQIGRDSLLAALMGEISIREHRAVEVGELK